MPGKRGGDRAAHERAKKAEADLKAAREKIAADRAEADRKAAAAAKAERQQQAAQKRADQDKRYGP